MALLLSPDGEELKRFCFADAIRISLARRPGLIVTLISGEDSPFVCRLANKLGIADIQPGSADEARGHHRVAIWHDTFAAKMCFMGDDVVDDLSVQQRVDFVTNNRGTNRVARELVDLLVTNTQTVSP